MGWPEEIPFRAESFQRYDESPDSLFYQDPRFVTHIDDKAIGALRGYYEEIFPGPGPNEDVAVLDLCSSWISPPRPTPSSEAPTRCTSCTAGKRRDARGSPAAKLKMSTSFHSAALKSP